MASLPIRYQSHLLSPRSGHDTTTDDDAGAERERKNSARRLNSCGNMSNNGGGGGGGRGNRGSGGSSGEQAAAAADGNNCNARIKRCQTAPGYVSFEDVIGREEAESGTAVISDPLVRTASRLYALEAGARRRQPPRHRHRSRSPGPLWTRGGSTMHWLFKKYLNPCLGFLAAAVFCRSPPASATCPISSCDCQVKATT